MRLEENISLKQYTTFGCNETGRYFTNIKKTEEVIEAITWCKEKQLPYLVLGTGSNILFTKPFEGLILKKENFGLNRQNWSKIWLKGFKMFLKELIKNN